uniref:Uncharacterized protein n=1 Tax=Glossina austeni TaxID=7395 RepID=A0A1A9VNR3_GLOAU
MVKNKYFPPPRSRLAETQDYAQSLSYIEAFTDLFRRSTHHISTFEKYLVRYEQLIILRKSTRELRFTVASFLISLAAHDIPIDFRFTASQKRFNHRSDKLHNNPLNTFIWLNLFSALGNVLSRDSYLKSKLPRNCTVASVLNCQFCALHNTTYRVIEKA